MGLYAATQSLHLFQSLRPKADVVDGQLLTFG
jgi:hypothetical protein